MSKLIALFDNNDKASDAVNELVGTGVEKNEISIVMNEDHSNQFTDVPKSEEFSNVNVTHNDKTAEGAAVGTATGGLIGAIVAGGLATIGPGIMLAGPMVSALAGAGAGGYAGGLVGFISGMGVDKTEAEFFAKEIENGSVAIAVETKIKDDVVKGVIKKHDGKTSKSV